MENFLTFAVCHCQKDRSLVWEELVDGIVKKTGLKIELKIFRDLEEELRYLDSSLPDIYFASFVNSCEAVNKSFVPVAKTKGLGHANFCLISRKDFSEFSGKEKEFFKLGLLKKRCLINLLLVLYQEFPISLTRILPIFFPSQEEIKNSFLKKHIDLALFSADFLKTNQEIIRSNFWLPISYHDLHFFMLNPGSPYFLWLKDFFLTPFTLKGLEVDLISQEEQFIKTFAILPELLSSLWEKALIYETFYKSPYLGMLIYRDDQILLANEYALKRLNYEPQDLEDYKMEDLFFEEKIKEVVKENIKRRCTGEFFPTVYYEIPVKTKQGRKRWFNVYADTIVFQGDFAGLSLVIDITSEVRHKKFIEVLKEINHLMIESYSEEELFDKVVKTLVKVLELKGTWIGEVDELTKKVKPILYYPETLSFINRVDPYLFSLENQTLSFYKAFHEKRINIIPDVEKYHHLKDVSEILKALNVRSVCSVPIMKGKRVSHVLVLWADEPNFFTEEYFELLEELKNNLSFALKKIDLFLRIQIFNNFIKQSEDMLIIADVDGKLEYLNPVAFHELEFEEDPFEVNIFKLLGITSEEINQVLKGLNTIKKIISLSSTKKRSFLEIKLTLVKFADYKKVIILGKNLTKEIIFEIEKQKMLTQDLLTGLLNYQGFAQKTTDLLQVVKEGILVLLDLYNFSYINHFYGLEAGDKVLTTVAQRLKESFPNALISRPVGDSFSLFLIDYEKKDVYSLIKKIQEIFTLPIEVKQGKRGFLEFQGGIVFYPEDGSSFIEIWRKANVLLSEVKKKGPNIIEIFNPYVEKHVENIFFVENLVKKAIQEHLFVFYYQPYFTSDLEVAGLEALVRIKADGKVFNPGDFIDYLENSPYLKDFEEISIDKNLETLVKIQKPVSINISSKSLETMHIFEILSKKVDLLKNIPCCLGIEITEHALATNLEKANKLLRMLKFYRINISIDDFGTGYSSLHYLKDLPIDFIKIDQSFVRDFLTDKKTFFILETIITLAKKLNIKTIAEGVETKEQFEVLKELGCDYFQGFLFAKPMPEEECFEYLKKFKKPNL